MFTDARDGVEFIVADTDLDLRLRLDVAHPVCALALGNKVEAPAMLGEPDLDLTRLSVRAKRRSRGGHLRGSILAGRRGGDPACGDLGRALARFAFSSSVLRAPATPEVGSASGAARLDNFPTQSHAIPRARANCAKTRSAMDGLHVFDHACETGSWRIASRAPTGALAPYAVAFNAYEERNTFFRGANCPTARRC